MNAHALPRATSEPRGFRSYMSQLAQMDNDAFPAGAGAGALPVMAWDDQTLRNPAGENGAAQANAPRQGPANDDGVRIGAAPARQLAPRGITGALLTVVEPPDDAVRRENAIDRLTVGDQHARTGGAARLQPAVGATPQAAVGNALHPTLYHSGSGAWQKTTTACDAAHFRKFRLASVNPKFRRCQEVCAPFVIHPHPTSDSRLRRRGLPTCIPQPP